MGLYTTNTRVSYLFISSILFLVGVPGNSLIIWTILRTKPLRNVHNILIVLLAIIDLLLIGYVLPFNMYVLIINEEPPRTFCKVNGMICDSLFTWSIQFIMLIALSRYVKMCHTLIFDKIFSTKTILIFVFLFFIIAFSFAMPLWFYDYLLIFDRTLHFCVFDRYGSKLYSSIYIVVCLVLPISITSFCYVRIYLHFRKSQNQLYKHWNNGLARFKLKNEILSLRPQFVVFLAYLILYFPFGLTSVAGSRHEDFAEDFHSIGIYMCFLSSCINIFIYGVMNRNMRLTFIKAIPCSQAIHSYQVNPTRVVVNTTQITEMKLNNNEMTTEV